MIICERPEAPVFSFYTHVDAGSVQDPMGKTGLAHMFEHMAFKGTDKIGTTNYPAEKAGAGESGDSLRRLHRRARQARGPRRAKAEATGKSLAGRDQADAQKYVMPNQFDEILERNGAEGVNASTDDDETNYFYSLPENRLELWAYLESERFCIR